MTPHVQSLIIQQLKHWENSRQGRMEKIVTVAWIIKKLKIRKYLSGLYGEIIERVREDEWYVTMEESIKGLETFADIPSETLRA